MEEMLRMAEESKLRGNIIISPLEQTIDATGMMRVVINRKIHAADIFFSGRAEPIKCNSDQFALIVKDGKKLISSDTIMVTEMLDYQAWHEEGSDYILSLVFQCAKVGDVTWRTGVPISVIPIVEYHTAMFAKCIVAANDYDINSAIEFVRSKYYQTQYLNRGYYLQEVLRLETPYHFEFKGRIMHGVNIQLGLIYSSSPVKVAFDCEAVYQIYNNIKNYL